MMKPKSITTEQKIKFAEELYLLICSDSALCEQIKHNFIDTEDLAETCETPDWIAQALHKAGIVKGVD